MRSARWWLLLGLATPLPATAQIDAAVAFRHLPPRSDRARALPRALLAGTRVPLIAERVGEEPVPPGAVAVGSGWFVLDASEAEARDLAEHHAGYRFHVSAPRRLLLDRADGWVGGSAYRDATGGSGRGVVVGIVDSGLDLEHGDFHDADGGTRVRWLIDFSRPAAGRQPELEAEYGCDGERECAVFSAADLDELLGNAQPGDEPRDVIGHGTHVASLAAGNGRSGDPARYVGVAPEADLIVARVTRGPGGSVNDPDVLSATRFVFDRARELGAPAVVNLSLGGSFGPHDGTTPLERALASFVGPEVPGRAIVVAAGNNAVLYDFPSSAYPSPFGIHAEVHVPRSSPLRVPLLSPMARAAAGDGTSSVLAWIQLRPSDELRVGIALNGEEWIPPLRSGDGASLELDGVEATVLNGVSDVEGVVTPGEAGAIVVIDGEWTEDDVFEILLEGQGTAAIWLESSGRLDPSVSPGALLPAATKEGTINLPAAHPRLIAVGATVNRNEWVDYLGDGVTASEPGLAAPELPGALAYFSAAGPNAAGDPKPDLVAPGTNVAGAMASRADPRDEAPRGLFSGEGRCALNPACYVVDDTHAVVSGTSMAAPFVAGAVALLFERDPSLSSEDVRALLQAGARAPEGNLAFPTQAGVGALDLEGTLRVEAERQAPSSRAPAAGSRIALAATFARPDPAWPLVGHVTLVDSAGRVADGFPRERLRLEVQGGLVAERLERLAPGFHRFAVAAPSGSGGGSLRIALRFDDVLVAEVVVPIAVDPGAVGGSGTPRGGCGLGRSAGGAGLGWLLLVLAVLGRQRRQVRE